MTTHQTENPPVPSRLLFVCTGNTCRSPLAEVLSRGLVEDLGLEGFEIRSAGTHTRSGSPASEGALRAARRHGYSLENHRATELSGDLVDWAHWIFVMGPGHLSLVRMLGGGDKAVLLAEAAQGDRVRVGETGMAVPDPFGGDDEIYEETFKTLKRYLELVIKRLAEEVGG